MNFEQLINLSNMKSSKEEVQNYTKQNNIYIPPNLTQNLLKWNSLPLKIFEINILEICFGAFFQQILKFSQNQQVKNQFDNSIKQFQQVKDINHQKQIYIELCRNAFNKPSLNPFPENFDCKTLDDSIQESFVVEIQKTGNEPPYYKSVKFLNQEPPKYKIFLYQNPQDNQMSLHILFSTNNDPQFSQWQFPQFKLQQFQIQTNQGSQQCQQHQNQKQQQDSTQRLQSFPVKCSNNNNQFSVRATQCNTIEQQNNQQILYQNQNNQPQFNLMQNNCGNNNFIQFKNTPIINNVNNPINTTSNQITKESNLNNNSQNQFNLQNPGCNYNGQISNQQKNNFIPLNNVKPQNFTILINNNPQSQYNNINGSLFINNNLNNKTLQFVPNQNITGSQNNNFPQQYQNTVNNKAVPQQQSYFEPSNSGVQTQIANNQLIFEKPQQGADDVFTTQAIISQQQDQKPEKAQNDRRIQTKYTPKENDLECQLCNSCYNSNSDEAIILPCCNKVVHRTCMQEDLNQKGKSNMNFSNINCFACQKSLENHQDFLKQNISNQLFFEITKKNVLLKIPLICCKCSSPIQAINKDKQLQIQCLNCNTKLCNLCCQEYHGQNQTNQQCPSFLTEIKKVFEGQPVLVCPFCNLWQTKDDKCNHVTCFNCKKDLCSACSVDRVPILKHGNHYHREGCPDYQPWILNNRVVTTPIFNRRDNCPICKEKNEVCKYPISLEEYKKQKNF